MTGLVILAAIVAIMSYPTGPTARGAVGPDVQLVAWAVVCVAMVAGLVAWAVLR